MGGPGLFFYGEYGVGKSSLGAILLKAAAAYQITSFWLNFKQLKDIDFHPEDFMFNQYMDFKERAIDVDFLFVDEFQCKSNLHWPIGVLEDIIRLRYQNLKTTCMSSNSSPWKIKESKVCGGLRAIMTEAMIGIRIEGKQFRPKP